MTKYLITLLLCCEMFLPTLVWAETERFKIAGTITFTETGSLYLEIVTKEQFEADEEQDKEGKEPVPSSPFAVIIPIGDEELKTHTVTFVFEGVPTGTYGIQCFQDVNGNGEMDMGMFGPKEPWGMYRPKRPKLRGPKFEEIQFEVKEDITTIVFEVK